MILANSPPARLKQKTDKHLEHPRSVGPGLAGPTFFYTALLPPFQNIKDAFLYIKVLVQRSLG